MDLTEKTVSSKDVFNGKLLHVKSDMVNLPDNTLATREYIKHSGASAIIAIDNDKIVLEHQYRYPVRQTLLEIPAGKIDNLETPLECAKRELLEETGYISQNWIYLGEALPCIAYSTEKISYFLATKLTFIKSNPDEGENIEVELLPFNEFLQKIYNNEILDSKTITGIMLYLGYLEKQKNLT